MLSRVSFSLFQHPVRPWYYRFHLFITKFDFFFVSPVGMMTSLGKRRGIRSRTKTSTEEEITLEDIKSVDNILHDQYPKLESVQEEQKINHKLGDSSRESKNGRKKRVVTKKSSPRTIEYEEIKNSTMNSIIKQEEEAAEADALRTAVKVSAADNGLEPPYWQESYSAIKEMRSNRTAPVDTVGCERLGNKQGDKKIFRFQTLVALMLSSQTKDPVTAEAINRLNNFWPDGLNIKNIVSANVDDINNCIVKVGFHNTKAKNIKRTANILHEKYNDDIPDTIEDLISLPGIGPKMAYLTMQVAWETSVGIGVDTHVHRIANRLGWVHTREPEQTRKSLEEWLPRTEWGVINVVLVGFGQQICLPINPKCQICKANEWCIEGQRNLSRLSRGLPIINKTKEQARLSVKASPRAKKSSTKKLKQETSDIPLKREETADEVKNEANEVDRLNQFIFKVKKEPESEFIEQENNSVPTPLSSLTETVNSTSSLLTSQSKFPTRSARRKATSTS